MNSTTRNFLLSVKAQPEFYLGSKRMPFDRLEAFFRGFYFGCRRFGNAHLDDVAHVLSQDFIALEQRLTKQFADDWFSHLLRKHEHDQESAFEEFMSWIDSEE